MNKKLLLGLLILGAVMLAVGLVLMFFGLPQTFFPSVSFLLLKRVTGVNQRCIYPFI